MRNLHKHIAVFVEDARRVTVVEVVLDIRHHIRAIVGNFGFYDIALHIARNIIEYVGIVERIEQRAISLSVATIKHNCPLCQSKAESGVGFQFLESKCGEHIALGSIGVALGVAFERKGKQHRGKAHKHHHHQRRHHHTVARSASFLACLTGFGIGSGNKCGGFGFVRSVLGCSWQRGLFSRRG